jgi:type I site-specific restriction endonuclease
MPALQWFHTEEREGRTYVFDPLRRREVALTPEEEVRQQVLYLLVEGLKVPAGLVAVEYSLKVNGMDRRADVVVFGKEGRPLMVVECKRPEVTLDQNVVDQALRYNNELNVRYIVITNGLKTFIFERQVDGWQFMQKAPLWGEMADGKMPAQAGHDADAAQNPEGEKMDK